MKTKAILVLVFSAVLFMATETPSKAQPQGMSMGEIPDAYVTALNQNSWTFFEAQELRGQLRFLLGPSLFPQLGAFSENQIAKDGELLTQLNRLVLQQQLNHSGIRQGSDLPNPFQSTLLTLPRSVPE